MLKKFIGLSSVVLFITCSPTVAAQDLSKEDMIREIIVASNAMENVRAMEDVIGAQLEAELSANGVVLNEEQKAEMLEIILETVGDTMDDMMPLFTEIYSRNFSEDEIADLYNFFQTDTGKKLSETTPDMVKLMAEQLPVYLQNRMPEMQQKIITRVFSAEN